MYLTHTQNNATLTGQGDFDIDLQDPQDKNQHSFETFYMNPF